MFRRPATLLRLLAVLGALILAALAGATTSQAASSPWGDLGHFGELNTELNEPEAAFGVNPADGSLWTVDVTGEASHQHFRLQKFEKLGSAWTAVASATLPVNEIGNTSREAEGVAFDTEKERAYVLITNEHSKAREEFAAAELLAFSTKTSGGKIEPATGTKAGGVLVPSTETVFTGSPIGKKEFSPSSGKGAALFTPGGLAVNPTNHQIVIAGSSDGKKPAVWAISSEGTIEADWEDSGNAFEKCGCLNSPVVTSAGKILVLGNELQEITEVPSKLKTGEEPKRAFWLPRSLECEELEHEKEAGKNVELCPFVEKLTQIDDGLELGDEMSLGPEGDLYVHLHVKNVVTEGGLEDGAVMVINPNMEEVGWTGGAGWGTGTKECAVNETNPGNLGASLVAGYKENVFMLERGDPMAGEHAKVLQLGPAGNTSNCPKGQLSEPVAEAGGGPLAQFPVADKISFSSKVQQANAISTEWEFEGEGKPVTVNIRQQARTSVDHQFKKGGTFSVKETVHSDDLASPTLTATKEVKIVTPEVKGEGATQKGTSALLKAEVNPNASPTTCEFEYSKEAFPAKKAGKIPCPTKPGEGEAFVPESVEATGLEPGTYHYRLVAKAGEWQSEQAGAEFFLSEPGAPVAETTAATNVEATSATLNGKVNPEGKEITTCKFEYGTALPSGTFQPCETAPGKGKEPVGVTAKLTGLANAKTYKFKLIAENSAKQLGEGGSLAFTTTEPATAPAAATLAPGTVSQTGAILKGTVNPHGGATTCHFEYGTTTGYGTTVACPTAPGSGRSNVEESASIAGLSAGTVYHYRIVAANSLGETRGADQEFKTASPPPPPPPPPTTTTTSTPPPPPHTEVLTYATPTVTLASSSLTVSPNGAFTLKLNCPTAAGRCSGTITVKTLTAVAARSARAHAAKKAILTLATGSFSITGSGNKVTLHLSAKAKKLLAKLHVVRARITILAKNPAGVTQTTSVVATLKPAKKKH